MSEIKPRREFDEPLRPEEGPTLRATQAFDEAQAFVPAVEEETLNADAPERVVENALKPRRSLWRRMVVAGLGLFGVSVVAQGVQWATNAWYTRDWIALGGCVAGGLIVAAGVGAIASEWRRLYRLRERAEERDEARELLASHRSAISRSAAESTLMIAVSPLALVDMAFIAWRNLRLVNRIATIYGIELGYYSRIRLFRLVLLNMAFAGASEMVREVGLDWMSQDLAARVSARVAQGLGAGLLTARLGVKAMELCRPLPWTEDDKPRLGDFRRQLLSEVKATLQKQKREREE